MFLFGCYNKRTKIDKVYCLGLHHFTNENTICLCRKGIYELMVESSSTTIRIRELSFSIHGRLARWGNGAVGRTDCKRKDSAVTNDLTTTLLGDVRKRVYTRHQQSRRTENSMCRQQSRPSEHLWCCTRLVQQPHSETHQQEGTTQIIRYH